MENAIKVGGIVFFPYLIWTTKELYSHIFVLTISIENSKIILPL